MQIDFYYTINEYVLQVCDFQKQYHLEWKKYSKRTGFFSIATPAQTSKSLGRWAETEPKDKYVMIMQPAPVAESVLTIDLLLLLHKTFSPAQPAAVLPLVSLMTDVKDTPTHEWEEFTTLSNAHLQLSLSLSLWSIGRSTEINDTFKSGC